MGSTFCGVQSNSAEHLGTLSTLFRIEMWLEIFLILVTLLLVLYRYVTKSFGKWKDLGIPYSKGYFPFGSYNFLSGRHLDDMSGDNHRRFADEKYFGWFLLGKPVLAINDVNIIKQIQVKDFDHFVDRTSDAVNRTMFRGGELDKLWMMQLTSITGDEWKEVRSAFTPIFTSGKMKGMLKFIKHVAGNLSEEMEQKAKEGEDFELKDVFGKFSLDALASSAFGVDGQSFKNKDSVFVKNAATIFKQYAWENLATALKFIPGVPEICELFKINFFKPKETKFFRDIIMQTIRARKETKERKNDLIDLMLDCIKEDTKEVTMDEPTDQFEQDMKLTSNNKSKHNLDELTVVATALVLLVAGYDTTGMTLTYLAYAMSKNPEIQQKLQEEVDQAFEDNNGELPDYNTIQSLPYIDMVLHETLRKFNPVSLNTRSCTQEYRIPGTDITLKKDDLISFSPKGLHEDPEHFSHPDEFWPEHFSKEEKAARNPSAFQAFGQGPRSCLGMRFAILEAKVAILSTWRRFSFKRGTKTQEPLVMEPNSALGYTKGGVYAKVVERE